MKTRTINTYQYEELSDDAKEKAIEWFATDYPDHDWWQYTEEDAKNVGIDIVSFDVDYRSHCNIIFMDSPEHTAHQITGEHAEGCETYKVAVEYLRRRDETIETAPRDEDGDFQDVDALDKELDDIDYEFRGDIAEEYLNLLRKEYEYITSRENIEECIIINEYEFTVDGNRSVVL